MLGCLGLTACAPAFNFVQPDGPRFQGNYAEAATGPAEAAHGIRVVTFNIKLSRRVGRAIQVLQDSLLRPADIIVLQEMNEVGMETIARSLHLNYVYFPAVIHPTNRRLFGPAILSPWPIERSWKLLLPHEASARRQRRTATAAVVRVGDRRVRVYAVHLETQARMSRPWHRDQAAAIVADAAGAAEPVIVAGDFNSQRIGHFFTGNGYRWPTERVGHTTWFFSFDHIFTRGFPLSHSDTAGVVRELRGASDHRPVWATLSVGSPDAVGSSSPQVREPPRRNPL